MARLVHQHHPDIAAGRGGPLPCPPGFPQKSINVLRRQPVHAGLRRVGRIAHRQHPTPAAHLQSRVDRAGVPLEGGFRTSHPSLLSQGGDRRPSAPRHYMLIHRHSPAPNHPRRQTAARPMASEGRGLRPACRMRLRGGGIHRAPQRERRPALPLEPESGGSRGVVQTGPPQDRGDGGG